jgi:organic hydroperoxide reductase OsmC/OhrA
MPSDGPSEHYFECKLIWSGAIQGGTTSYDSYSREFRVEIAGKGILIGSSAAVFRGDPRLHNPEDLLVASLSSCHFLSYLADAARAHVVVIDYEDQATGTMAKIDGKIRFREVILRPKVGVARGTDLQKARRLHHDAHEHCFIANSVNFPVNAEPTIIERA